MTFSSPSLGTAGDDECVAPQGGIHCALTVFPPGFGIRLFSGLHLSVELNDVRAAQSAPLEWALVSSLRLLAGPVAQPVLSWLSFNPVDLRRGEFGLYYYVPAAPPAAGGAAPGTTRASTLVALAPTPDGTGAGHCTPQIARQQGRLLEAYRPPEA